MILQRLQSLPLRCASSTSSPPGRPLGALRKYLPQLRVIFVFVDMNHPDMPLEIISFLVDLISADLTIPLQVIRSRIFVLPI
jgi:hypothetical protein